jgi:RHS repeat-associated protein
MRNNPKKVEEASSGKNGAVVPSLSLPKGGGAIRGIGEKFAANPVTGTGSLTVPIFTTPGRSGFGPQLLLSYDSGSGNGPFGFGWSLSLPSITRKTDKGLPRYQDAEESDVFILSGAEDLVPVLVNQNGQWQRDPLDSDDGAFVIQRYRPRIEGLFARIERWTNKQTGDIHWRSISRENITTIYGKTDNSRIAGPVDPMRVFSWLISESYDDKGNAIIYEYKAEDSANVGTFQAHEENRSPLTRSANRYLKRIKYGNQTSRLIEPDLSQMNWLFEVVFDYDEGHYEAQPIDAHGCQFVQAVKDKTRDWSVRQDSFSSYRAGFEVRTYRMCHRVLMFHHFPQELGTEDYLVRSTDFRYNESPIASFITEITPSGYVRKEDGMYLKKSLPPLEFEYSKATINEEIQVVDAESLENLPSGLDGMRYQWVDLDGEGISGPLIEQADAWFYKPNKGGGKFGPLQLLADKPSLADLNSGRQQLMDLAGDGQLDLVELSGLVPGFYERTKDQRWQMFIPFAFLPNVDWKDPNLKFLDLTGDGHADIMITEDEVFTWYPSLAEKGFGPAIKVYKPYDEEKGPRLVFNDGTQSIYLADLSGDGLTDLVRIRNGEVCYWPNLGYGRFGGAKVTMDNVPWFDYPDLFDQQRIRLADIDGSGTTDIIYLGRDGIHLYFNQSGNSWSEARTLTQFPHIDNLTAVTVADLKGNGTACIVWSSPLPRDSGLQMQYIDLMGNQKPHLLVGVKNNLGAETKVHYAPSTKFYLDDKEAGKPWITRTPFPVHVVERVETYDRISGNCFVTRYEYHHDYFDGEEREFRGFGMVEQWDTEEFGTLNASDACPSATNIDEASHVPPVWTKTWFHTGAYLDGSRISKQFAGEYYREGDPSREEGKLADEEFQAMLLSDTVLPPEDLTAEETHEACRSLKGGILRQEIYALDRRPDGTLTEESKRPYRVSERNYTIKRLQPQGDNKHAVFFVHPRETIDYHYERKLLEVGGKKLADPRVSHQITLNVDKFGNVERSVAIGYPRRAVPDRQDEQTETHITLTVNRFINSPELPIKFPECYSPEDPNWYRTGLPAETQTYEILNPPEPAVSATSVALFKFEDIRILTEGLFPLNQDEPDTSKTHPYEKWNWRKDTSTPRERKLRLIERVRTLYCKNDLTGLLPLGCADSLALPGETYKLAFTPDLLKTVYQREREGENPENLLPDPSAVLESTALDGGGYVDLDGDGHWWIPSGRVYYWQNTVYDPAQELDFARKHFFLPHRFSDPFDNNSIVTYDSSEPDPGRNYNLLLMETRDALGNTVTVENDYRVLQPKLMTDPNGNRSAAAFDVIGLVVGTAVMGKAQEPDGKPKGDSLDEFEADITLSDIQAFVADPRETAANLLKGATTRIIYDIDRVHRCGQPPFAATLMREIHAKDPEGDHSPIQITMTYSDGFGREVQTKLQAEQGDAPQREPDEILPGGDIKLGKLVLENGKPKQAHTDHRWVGKGRTVYNNKGKPVKQYEPYFSSTHLYEEEPEMTDTGVSPILFYDPVERVVATLHPNNTYEKVVFDPWQQKTYDVNDTVIDDSRIDPDISGYVAEYFKQVAPQPVDWETWLQQRGVDPFAPPQDVPGLDPEKKAAVRTLVHADTPTTAFFDPLGRTFLTIAHNKFERRRNGAVDIIEGKYRTQVVLDIEGNQREVRDERKNDQGDPEERVVMRSDYDMLGNRIHQASMEAGERWMLNDVTGKPIRARDSRGHAFTIEYDALRRPTRRFVEGTDPVHSDPRMVGNRILYGKVVYGEDYAGSRAGAAEQNLLTRAWKQFDSAGVVINETYDFKGNLLCSSRRLVKDYKTVPDWETFPEPEDMPDDWGDELFQSSTHYDALNRPIQLVVPHADSATDVIQPGYNEANLLEKLDVWLKNAGEPAELLMPDTADQHFVTNIDYNAKGQREFIEYGNGVRTQYEYDSQTFRLTHLFTTRGTSFPTDCSNLHPCADPPRDCPKPRSFTCGLQNIHYTYDPVGNITAIRDDAQQTIYFNGQVVRPDSEYKYDAIYRLIESHGREHIGQASIPHTTWNDRGRVSLAHPHDGSKMRNYFEFYEYDEAGNILKFDHKDHDINWIRAYDYNEASLIELGKKSNRLSYTVVHPDSQQPITEPYSFDAHGNMTSMPHLPVMVWDFEDQLHYVKKGSEKAYYVYDAAGQRVRKVVEMNNGTLIEERIYLSGFEVFRQSNGNGLKLERETLHIMDDKQRIALVETRTEGNDPAPQQLIRYQFGNHLGSASLELDHQAQIISYEEYTPYGSTSYQAVRRDIEVPIKRYRYTGKERDEESGLYYHGARYFVPWLAIWASCDPAGVEDGPGLYAYARQNPAKLVDQDGRQAQASQERHTDPEFALEAILGPPLKKASLYADPEKMRSLLILLKNLRKEQMPTDPDFEARMVGLLEDFFPQSGTSIWERSKKPLAGYVGSRWGARPRMQRAKELGMEEAQGRSLKRRFIRSDIVFFQGHHHARFGSPGYFTFEHSRATLNVSEMRFRASRVKLVMISSCRGIAPNALQVFRPRFPNAYILGWLSGSPFEQNQMMTKFLEKLPDDLVLEKESDIKYVVNEWQKFVENYKREGVKLTSREGEPTEPFGVGFSTPSGEVTYYTKDKSGRWRWKSR